MGHQIIKQPDKLYGIFSTHSDRWVAVDCVAEEAIDFFVQKAAREARERAYKAIQSVARDNASKVYAQFTKTFEEANAIHNESHEPMFDEGHFDKKKS